MCGIAGIFAFGADAPPVDAAELATIRDRMTPRGPDGAGLHLDDARRIGLAHRRLAIVDVSEGGHQPMSSPDGRYAIVYNGELYNAPELRRELERDGRRFRSSSDTEVLLAMFERDGVGMLARLRGMFAFAVWDSATRTLTVARDRFGIKPLYLQDDGRTLRFASQVKALLAGAGPRPEREPAGLVGFWLWGHVPEPWTLHRGIVALEAGSWMSVDGDGRRRSGRYARLDDLFAPDPSDEPLPDLRTVIDRSVEAHLIADVPVGVFLSAGIDSTTLAAVASRVGSRLRTVTVGFEAYRGTAVDEVPLATEMARRLGTDHRTVWIAERDLDDALPGLVDAMDQPTIDGLNTWLVARAAAQAGLKVALSGLGGDELFAGYPSFRQVPGLVRALRPMAAVPAFGRAIRRATVPWIGRLTSPKYAGLLELGGTFGGAFMLRRAMHLPWELSAECGLDPDLVAAGLQRLGVFDRLEDGHRGAASPRAKVSLLEAEVYMRDRLLRDADWAGMAHSIEIRVPLVDTEVWRHVGRCLHRGSAPSKRDLATVAEAAMVREVVERPKSGFGVPIRQWLQGGARAASSDGAARYGLRDWQRLIACEFAV